MDECMKFNSLKVLILVLMEDTLGDDDKFSAKQAWKAS